MPSYNHETPGANAVDMQDQALPPRTEESYTRWIERFVRFHRAAAGEWVHPSDMSAEHVETFLTYLAVHRRVAATLGSDLATSRSE